MSLSRADEPVAPAEFAEWMSVLGPFEPAPALGVAVSGGADSLALAMLARNWAAERGGTVLALVVDHGLRPASAGETAETLGRLAACGIPAWTTRLALPAGAALAARARQARYAALAECCVARGLLHLLLGHHAGDQAETLLMRALAGSRANGLAGMAVLRETGPVRLLRPLLGVPPGRLRATLDAKQIDWVEDPSNLDPAALRARIRIWRADPDGAGRATGRLAETASAAGKARAAAERGAAAQLAVAAAIHPEGFAVLRPGPAEPTGLAALLQVLGGRPYPPSPAQVAALARNPRPATLAGVRLSLAGRLGPGLLLSREEAAMAAPGPAWAGTWDGRFRLIRGPDRAASGRPMLGPLGPAARRFRDRSTLPALVLRTLPAIWLDGELVAVPHLGFPETGVHAGFELLFAPPRPAAGGAFLPSDAPWGCRKRPDHLSQGLLHNG